MQQYVALLRGINVGGHRVKMDALRELFEELGFSGVSTFIASGNVIFSTEPEDGGSLTERIERHLAERLGYEVATFLRTPAEIEAINAIEPEKSVGGGQEGASLYVVFLRSPASDDLRATFVALSSEMDEFQFSGREIYWHIGGKLTESPLFGGPFEKATRGIQTTTRNMTTLRRLLGKLELS